MARTKQERVAQYLGDMGKFYDDYFKQKENLCHAILAAEIAIMASIFAAPIPPSWFDLITAAWPRWAPTALLVLFFLGTALFLLTVHSLLLMQLRLRRVADFWGDSIRFVLLKWQVSPPTRSDLKAIGSDELLKQKFPKLRVTTSGCIGDMIQKYIFPYRRLMSTSNSNSLLLHMPNDFLVRLEDAFSVGSYAEQFERIVAGLSVTLLTVDLLVVLWRLCKYLSADVDLLYFV